MYLHLLNLNRLIHRKIIFLNTVLFVAPKNPYVYNISILLSRNTQRKIILRQITYFTRVLNSPIHSFSSKSREHKIANAEYLSKFYVVFAYPKNKGEILKSIFVLIPTPREVDQASYLNLPEESLQYNFHKPKSMPIGIQCISMEVRFLLGFFSPGWLFARVL